MSISKIRFLVKQGKRINVRSPLIFCGVMHDVRTWTVKNGKLRGQAMGKFKVETYYGDIQFVCFPNTFEQCSHLVRDGSAVVCSGQPSRNEDSQDLVADSIVSVERWAASNLTCIELHGEDLGTKLASADVPEGSTKVILVEPMVDQTIDEDGSVVQVEILEEKSRTFWSEGVDTSPDGLYSLSQLGQPVWSR